MQNHETFDYIIIGAGSAGCAVAARLSENPNNHVLLLEAGGDDKIPTIVTPIRFTDNFKTEVDWCYYYAPNSNTNNREDYMPRGKVLGGSSSINAMIYQRGNPENYNQWEREGNIGWGWNDVLPYFLKSEHQERGASKFHGVQGPLHVSDLQNPNIMSQAFVNGCQELGYSLNNDFNAGNQEGFGLYQVTIKDGQRCSAANAYLDPAKNRQNLLIAIHCLVSKIIIENDVCVGVEYRQNNQIKIAKCHKEVILSAGTFNTPQIMMLSGLGPKEVLDSCGIKVIHDIQGVGRNLHDHASVMLSYYCSKPISLAGSVTEETIKQYEKKHSGLLTSNQAEAGGFVKLTGEMPEIQYHFHAAFHPSFYEAHNLNSQDVHGVSLVVSVANPTSRGYLKIVSADPRVHPYIDGNIFSSKADMDTIIEGVIIGRKLMNTRALKEFIKQEYLPGKKVSTKKELESFIRQYGTHIYHPVGTCKMGNDKAAVVNYKLQVHNIQGLRIADASIMPSIVNANTNAPSIMIGEKCAAMILQSS